MLKVVLYVMVQKEKEWSGWDLNNCYLSIAVSLDKEYRRHYSELRSREGPITR